MKSKNSLNNINQFFSNLKNRQSNVGIPRSDDFKLDRKIKMTGNKINIGKTPWNKGVPRSENDRKKISDSKIGIPNIKLKGRVFTEEHRFKISQSRIGEKNPNWVGGKSFEPYSPGWTRPLKETIRKNNNNICKLCGKKQENTNCDVHHIDYDKKNCSDDNLVTLCHGCHTKTNYNRKYWKEYFINKNRRRLDDKNK